MQRKRQSNKIDKNLTLHKRKYINGKYGNEIVKTTMRQPAKMCDKRMVSSAVIRRATF